MRRRKQLWKESHKRSGLWFSTNQKDNATDFLMVFWWAHGNRANTSYDTLHHGGGSIMVLGCLSSPGIVKLAKADGKTNRAKTEAILEENLVRGCKWLERRKFTFYDNPEHISKSIVERFSSKHIYVLHDPKSKSVCGQNLRTDSTVPLHPNWISCNLNETKH